MLAVVSEISVRVQIEMQLRASVRKLECEMVRKLKILGVIAMLAAVVSVVWQVAAAQIENRELQSDLREVAAQIGGRIGLAAPSTEDDLRNTVIQRAAEHEITLRPDQVEIERVETDGNWGVSISVNYDVSVGLLGARYPMHFNLAASRQ